MSKYGEKITIKHKLKKEGCKVLDSNSWLKKIYQKCWESVRVAYVSQENNPGFVKSENRSSDLDLLDKLEQRCQEVINLPYSDNKELYEEAKKWCVIPHSLKERAELMGFTFLNTELDNNKDEEIWEMRIRDYRPNEDELPIPTDSSKDIEEQIKIFKKTSKMTQEKMNYEEDAEKSWRLLTRMFTKDRP